MPPIPTRPDAIRAEIPALWEGLGRHMQEVWAGATVAVGVKIFTAVLQLALNFALARTLGAEGAGLFFLAFTVTWTVAVVARLGLDNVVLREIAVCGSRQQWGRVRGLVRVGLAVVLASSALLGLLVFLNARWLALVVFDSPDLVSPLRWTALALPPLACSLLTAEMLRGLRKIFLSLLVSGSLVPGVTAIGVVLLAPRFGSVGSVWAFIGGATFAAVAALLFWFKVTPMLRGVRAEYVVNHLFQRAKPIYLYALMFMVINWASFVFLGIYGTEAEVGVFGVAWRTSLLISFLLPAAESIAAPKIAALHAGEEGESLRKVCQSISLGLTVVGLPILLVILFWHEQIMALFGQEFRAGGLVLLFLAIGRLITLALGPVNMVLIMTGHERSARNVITVVVIYVVLGNFLFVPTYGALGAAIVGATGFVLLHSLSAIEVRRHLGFWAILPVMNLFQRSPPVLVDSAAGEPGSEVVVDFQVLQLPDVSEDWDAFVAGHARGHYQQTTWWLSPLMGGKVSVSLVAARRGSRFEGGGLFRTIRVPGVPASLMECLGGPLFTSWQPSYASRYVEAIRSLADQNRCYAVVLRSPRSVRVQQDLLAAFREVSPNVQESPGELRLILDLSTLTPGQVPETGHPNSVRSALKKARARCSSFRSVTSTEELRSSWDLWDANACKKGINRPPAWGAWAPTLHQALNRGQAEVFGAFDEQRLISAVLVAYVGNRAAWIYSGSTEDARPYNATHPLILEMIGAALNRGLQEFDMGSQTSKTEELLGIDRFKMGFGAVPRRENPSLTWVRMPIVFELIESARSSRFGGAIENLGRKLVLP